jgi:hypothetical protein
MPCQPRDLFKGQQLVALQKREIAAEDLLGHAVRAAEVAAIRDRDPEIVDRASEGV